VRSKVSKVTSHTVVGAVVAVVVVATHPKPSPPFSKQSTAQHRDRDRDSARGQASPFAPFGGAHTTHHLCRPQVPEAGPRLKPAGPADGGRWEGSAQTPAETSRDQGVATQPVASLTWLLRNLIRPPPNLLRAVSDSCNLSANLRAGGSTFQERLSWSLRTAKRGRCISWA